MFSRNFLLLSESLLQQQIIQIFYRVDPEVLGSDVDFLGIAQGEERPRSSFPRRPEDGEARAAFRGRRPIRIQGVDEVD